MGTWEGQDGDKDRVCAPGTGQGGRGMQHTKPKASSGRQTDEQCFCFVVFSNLLPYGFAQSFYGLIYSS